MITIGIKALNEERNIAMSIESALAAASLFGGRVVLADSGSTDNTIQIASRYSIDIVQLADFSERCCGAGAQLAFQYADGEYFYLLDGDMVLHADFLQVGIRLLEGDPQLAAVGGLVTEKNVEGQDFSIRAQKAAQAHAALRYVDRLDCGGLYRVKAITSVGYFADRNLHSFEEFELGARLTTSGWKLARVPDPAVDHYGHVGGGYRLLWRRFTSGYAGGAGEVFRSALGKKQMTAVILGLRHLPLAIVVLGWWAIIVAALAALRPSIAFIVIALPLIFLVYRRRSVSLGIYSMASWNLNALATIVGGLRKRTLPTIALNATTVMAKSDVSAARYDAP